MKQKFSFLLLVLLSIPFVNAQIIELSFTAKSDTLHVPLDSVYIKNVTQVGDTTLIAPDSIVLLGTVGLENNKGRLSEIFDIINIYPNPFNEITRIDLSIPGRDVVKVKIYNSFGKEIESITQSLDRGINSFTFSSGGERMFYVSVAYRDEIKSGKILSINSAKQMSTSLQYKGLISDVPKKMSSSLKGFPFNAGDELQFIGFAYNGKDTLYDAPAVNSDYTFDFQLGIHCPDLPFFTYDGQVYSTVKINDHCWMAENMNVGTRIDGNLEQTDNSIIEKYCYNDDPANCDVYGGLYQWDEMMQYSVAPGSQGICPAGWHIPTNEEWKILEGSFDSQYGVGDAEWDIVGWRGFDAGKNLKSTTSWNNGSGADLYGFSALAAGRRIGDGSFGSVNVMTYMWISLEYDASTGWCRYLNDNYDNIRNGYFDKTDGRSVRCIRDCQPQPTQAYAGIDSLNAPGNSIVLQANTPIIGQGIWSIFEGQGGYFYDSLNPTTTLHGIPGILYKLVWSISNNCGTSSDTVMISFEVPVFVCDDSIVDARDAQVYKTVQIGNQCWMAENLNIGSHTNVSQTQTDNGVIEKYCYNDNTANCDIYGGLYQWNEMMEYDNNPGVQGICPADWHLPTEDDWKVLEGYVDNNYNYGDPVWDNAGWRGYDAGEQLKSTAGWTNNNGTDVYDFTLLPGGKMENGTFKDWIGYAYLWTSTVNGNEAWMRAFAHDRSDIYRNDGSKYYAYSVRCLKVCYPLPTQANAGPDMFGIIDDSVVLQGNTPLVGQGVWTIKSGVGGSFADSANPNTVFYGLQSTTYDLSWTISNNCGSSTDNVVISFADTNGVKKVLSPPAIDGLLEESFWNLNYQVDINIGYSDNFANFGLLWDDDYLYIGIIVEDGTLCVNGRMGWNDDGVEICIDGDHSMGTSFNQYDRRFVKPVKSYWMQEEDGQLQYGVKHKYIETADGYSMEFAIPWNNFNVNPYVGLLIGFDIAVNDDDDFNPYNGVSQLLWSGTSEYYKNSSLWGTIMLGYQTVDYSSDYLALISPNGGDFLINNNVSLIEWQSHGITNVDIEYSIDNGNTWSSIVTNYPANNGSYSWNVSATPSEQCLIRIYESGNPSLNDISESVFTINAPLTGVQPIIPNIWKNYQWPYNAYFPLEPNGINGHIGNACGHTSLARIFHTWEFPVVGNDSLTFTDVGGYTWSANFGATTYNYDKMPDYLPPNSTPSEYHDAATLVYHAATSMHDVYGSGTDITNMSYAMSHYFRYKVSTEKYRKNYTKAEWTKILMNELDNGRVLLMNGMTLEHLGNWHENNNVAGHWYNVDGYDSDGRFHVVVGFGNHDGYYDADSLWGFSFNLETLTGLEPDLNGKEISIIVPDGANVIVSDADTTITWNSVNVTDVKIEYTLDNGQNWNVIVASTPANAGSYTWSVPNITSYQCRIRITDVSDVNVYDKSDSVFSIVP